jgi:AraC family transcriptional regulator
MNPTVVSASYEPHPFSSLHLDSRDIGWRSALLQRFTLDARADGAELAPVPALTVVMTLRGRDPAGSVDRGGRAQARQRAGDLGMRAPGHGDRLRWRAEAGEAPLLLRLQVPDGVVAGLSEDLRGSGAGLNALADTLGFSDPTVAQAMRSLDHAARDGAPDLVAATTAQFVTAHLLCGRTGPPAASLGSAGRRAVEQARDLIHDSLAEDLTLDDMARAASVSPFHLIRLFRRHEGITPYRYLLRLRLERAAELLRRSELNVGEVAASCGFADPAHFAKQFRRRYAASPSAYRRCQPGRHRAI